MSPIERLPKPTKRLALFFDGTWNEPKNNTNVWRLKLMLSDTGHDGLPQRGFYDEGVGTHWYDRISGGAIGVGLTDNVRDGYRWLIENYSYGDDVFVFGFSRGAFTARSLVGMIARLGILKPDAPMSFEQAIERYRKRKNVRPIVLLRSLERQGETKFDFEEKVLLEHSWHHKDMITMVGVWDTVGSIGLNLGRISGISSSTLKFHNTDLSNIVRHNYQALALDEYRKPYWAILWTHLHPDRPDPTDEQYADDTRMIEQRWFSGAHADVGGGYWHDLMPELPLAWLQGKAIGCNLSFRTPVHIDPAEYRDVLKAMPKDSYGEFLLHLWKILTFGQRYVRWVKSDPTRRQDGIVHTVNERIDKSVFERMKLHADYHPRSIKEWQRRTGIDLRKLMESPESFPDITHDVTTPGIEGCPPRDQHSPFSVKDRPIVLVRDYGLTQ